MMEEEKNKQDESSMRGPVDYETVEHLVKTMVKDPVFLKNGFHTFSKLEKYKNFYINLLSLIFTSELPEKDKKLAASTFKIFLKKNWSDNEYITDEERLVSTKNCYIFSKLSTY